MTTRFYPYHLAPIDGTPILIDEGNHVTAAYFHAWSDEEREQLPPEYQETMGFWNYLDSTLQEVTPEGPTIPFRWTKHPDMREDYEQELEPEEDMDIGEDPMDILTDRILMLRALVEALLADDANRAMALILEKGYLNQMVNELAASEEEENSSKDASLQG